jgi:hypothetical protein
MSWLVVWFDTGAAIRYWKMMLVKGAHQWRWSNALIDDDE